MAGILALQEVLHRITKMPDLSVPEKELLPEIQSNPRAIGCAERGRDGGCFWMNLNAEKPHHMLDLHEWEQQNVAEHLLDEWVEKCLIPFGRGCPPGPASPGICHVSPYGTDRGSPYLCP